MSSRVHVKQPRLEWGFFIALYQLHKRMVPLEQGTHSSLLLQVPSNIGLRP
ncbi:hypothetical protein SynPROS91_01057 [Synechococcus sp. PROS-9-1]|nr:hypothetical protein SynPROS91_01057 [Synechococcus sp. PROS-9-1]